MAPPPRLRSAHDEAALVATRGSWHRLAERVVAKARYVEDGSIRLEAWPGGFATPPLPSGRRVGVRLATIVVEGPGGARTAPITTVREAAAFAEVEAGLPADLYPPATPDRPDEVLPVDLDACEVLAAWYGFTAAILERFRGEVRTAGPSPLVLWPEHFDQAFATEGAPEAQRANFGASPGDDGHPQPYLYLGPWAAPPAGPFWDAPHFPGALLGLPALAEAASPEAAALDFLRRGRAELAG